MSTHQFRHPELFEQRPERDFIREHCPNGSDGFVVEDLDLILRCYGPNYGTDSHGIVRLVEIKHGNAPLGESKLRTFRLIDSILATSDRYDGFYVIRTNRPDWENETIFTVNNIDLDPDEFVAWLNFQITIPPLFPKEPR